MAPEIILYHYPFSPYARRVVWYLNLREIPYTECIQPHIMPRPDLAALGTQYRRIPSLSIGRDIYNDTRLILLKLEALYPPSAAHPGISAASPSDRALERLLDLWITDAGVFARAAQLIPSEAPVLKDPRFQRDRAQMTGRKWDKDAVDRMRPEALVEVRGAFEVLEGFLGDGRDWIAGGEKPTLADIEAIFPFHWLTTLPGALPPNLISASQFPQTFAYLARFTQHTRTAASRAGKPKAIKGPEALALVSSSPFAEPEGAVDANDPSGLQKGHEVEVWPVDSGFSHKDRGKLVGLDGREVVVEGRTEGGVSVRIHAPRHGFRVRAVGGGAGAGAKL